VTTIHVTSDQVDAARTLIKIAGGEDKVDPVIVRIAHAEKPHRSGSNRPARAS
jgi:hypothetical protein